MSKPWYIIAWSMNKKISYYVGNQALAFSDVYLLPAYSDIKSRHGGQIDTKTPIALGAPKLNIPIISAGMDTVTEDAMAETFALNGGLGEIHRNNTPEKQAELVTLVKERVRVMEKNPPTVAQSATIADALNLLEKRHRGYVIITPKENFTGDFIGIATSRDFKAASPDTSIAQVMTKLSRLVTVPQGTTLQKAFQIMRQRRIEKIPVINKSGKLIGVYTTKDYEFIQNHPNAVTDSQGRLIVGAAIGVQEIDIDRAHRLVRAGVDVLFLDIAHGHSIYTKTMLKRLKDKEKITTPIIVGNIASTEGVKMACDIGADGIKIGIGPGFVCKTRNVAGTGVPQITAILEARAALSRQKNPPPIIADGGIREPGDVPKAIAAGADSVMIGSLLAGTDQSPGDIIKIDGSLQKRIRGMASKGVFEDRKKIGETTTNSNLYTPEGRETFTPFQGSSQQFINEYVGGLRSAMSYAGAHSIPELQKAGLIHVSSSGANEQGRALS